MVPGVNIVDFQKFSTKTRNEKRAAQALAPGEYENFKYDFFRVFTLLCFRDQG